MEKLVLLICTYNKIIILQTILVLALNDLWGHMRGAPLSHSRGPHNNTDQEGI